MPERESAAKNQKTLSIPEDFQDRRELRSVKRGQNPASGIAESLFSEPFEAAER